MPIKQTNNEMIKTVLKDELTTMPKAVIIAPIMYVIAVIKIITTAPFGIVARCNRVMRQRRI